MVKLYNTSLAIILLAIGGVCAGGGPVPGNLQVYPKSPQPGPRITAYLQYQVEAGWRQDEARLAEVRNIHSEAELKEYQAKVRNRLLEMLGGLPSEKTPLNARITGEVRMQGYRIENLIFESLPGFHVTALLYLPDKTPAKFPAVLVPCGHSANGKNYYQYICHRLARRGYIALCWDPVGQGERSQFWDAANSRSRYNLVCGEHGVIGNLAYLVGANLARWEIWDGMRALDYLLTRSEVDPQRISIIGTSGGGFQSSHIGALDGRIKTIVPSCYISSLPMRMNNRIFKDPDSDPEQDLYRMVSGGVDHAGLMLLMYPRPVLLAAAVEDFFPIEGTRKTFRETAALYRRFGHEDRIALVEGYHGHQLSPENLEAAMRFMDRHNGMPADQAFPEPEKLDDQTLQCTKSGQVLLDFKNGRSVMDLILEYFTQQRRQAKVALETVYRGEGHPGIGQWQVTPYAGFAPGNRIAWQERGREDRDEMTVDKYLLHHSRWLAIPLLHIHARGARSGRALLWFSRHGKARDDDWTEIAGYVKQGYEVVSFDFRGLGEDRMFYNTGDPKNSSPSSPGFDSAYTDFLSGVLANYVYNSLLTGRPYFLQMIEDAEIVVRFAREKLACKDFLVAGKDEAIFLAQKIAQVLPGIQVLARDGAKPVRWSDIVQAKREIWPIEYLLPGGAYID